MKGDVVAKKTLQLALGVAKWRIAVMEEAIKINIAEKNHQKLFTS